MWKNVVERGGPQIIWHILVECWIPKATNAHTDCVLLIAFPLLQWLHERASVLLYTYIACLIVVPDGARLTRHTVLQAS
jgi:hypothetical protein